MIDFSSAATSFKEGGIFMYFMLAVAVFVISIAIERFIVIGRASGLNGRKLMDDVVRAVKKGDMASARNISRMSGAPAAQVAEAMLLSPDTDPTRLQSVADDAATLALSPLSRRLPHLNVLANVATLLGLLGTISGLITAFSAVGAADPAQRSAFMAAGISTALNATAFGLIIAIPTLLLQGFLVGMVDGVAEQVDEMSIRLTQALTLRAANLGASQVVAMKSGMAARGGAQ
jgi:biopolymer transport protein ExbB/TolQ